MFDLIEKTPIATLIPLGNRLFKGRAREGQRTLDFVIMMTPKGEVKVRKAVFRVHQQAHA